MGGGVEIKVLAALSLHYFFVFAVVAVYCVGSATRRMVNNRTKRSLKLSRSEQTFMQSKLICKLQIPMAIQT